MKMNQIQTNFTAGEISPRLWAHVDMAKYKNAIKTGTNAVCLPHGPIRRRNGFKYIAEVKTSSNGSTRLLRFQFNQDNAYILEFGNLYIRFYKDGGQVLSGGLPYEVTTTYTTAELFEITYVQFGRILYLFHGSHAPAQLIWTSDTSWVLKDIVFYPIPTIEDGVLPTTTITPAATSGTGINFTAGSAMFVAADIGRQIQNLTNTGIAVITGFTSTTVVVCDILENFPNTSAISSPNWRLDLSPIASVTMSGSRLGSIVTATSATNATWNNSAARTTDVGRYLLIGGGIGKVTSYTSGTVINVELQKGLTSAAATTAWTVEDPVWNSTNGYPATCALHQQRLWAASTDVNPERVWASEVGIYDAMGIGSSDSDALDFDLSNKEISTVSWMANIRGDLVIGTNSSEITVEAGSTVGAITPSNIVQQVRGYHGSNLQQPIGLDDQVLYIQRSGKKINAFRYDFQIDNYISEDLLFLAEHMPSDLGIKEICYAQDPDRNLYVVLNDGDLLVCTYIKEQQVLAWTRITTDGTFESINTISTGANDEVWVQVKRTINGSTKRYIERLDISTGEDNLDGFSDCYLTYSNPKTITGITRANPGVVTANSHGYSNGDYVKHLDVEGMSEINGRTYIVANKTANTYELNDTSGASVNTTGYSAYTSGGESHKLITTVSGLSHLEGEEVQVKTDGGVHENKTVSGGAITLDSRSYEVTVGLPYTTTIITLPKEFALNEGSQQGQPFRWVKPILRVYKSTIPTIDGDYLPARLGSDTMDKAIDLYTGDLFYSSIAWKDGFSSPLTIETNRPLPLVLLGIFGSSEGGSR